jgi:hypothetical protein
MNQAEMGLFLHLIHNPEPEMAICQNPQCNDIFTAEESDALFCPKCEEALPPLTKANIRYAIENNIAPDMILRHIMNGDTR